MKKRDLFLGCIALAFLILGSIEYPLPTEPEPTEDIIHWKDEEVVIEEVHIEDVEVEVVTEPTEEEIKFYNVPLSEELQLHIFKECEKYNIAPSIVLAIMYQESRYQADAVSKYGDIGIMQVNPKWHWNRMEKLGCEDLYNPFQNITVGIDYLGELKAMNDDLYWVLMAYNEGTGRATERLANGNYSNYALGIVERASELEKEVE